MAVTLHHLIIPAKDKHASAQLFAELFGLTVKPSEGRFAQVPLDEHLTIDWSCPSSLRLIPAVCKPVTGGAFSGEQCWFSFARVEVPSERRVRCPQKKARYSVAAKTTQCAGSLRVARMGSRGVLAS